MKTEKEMSKAAMKRLLKSEFFKETAETVQAWDYYLTEGNKELADEMMREWFVAKLALEHITGKSYELSRNGETFSIVNEKNRGDIIVAGHSIKPLQTANEKRPQRNAAGDMEAWENLEIPSLV